MKSINITYITSIIDFNSAQANRILCSAKGFEENGAEVKVINLSNAQLKPESSKEVPAVPVITLSRVRDRYIGIVVALLKSIRFVRTDSIVILYLFSPFYVAWFRFFASKRTHLVFEETEFPNINKNGDNVASKRFDSQVIKLDAILTISQAIKKYYVNLGYDQHKVHLFPMIVDPSRFQGKMRQIIKGDYIAYCGSGGLEKDGLSDLIYSFYEFSKDWPDVKLIIIGKFYKDAEEYLSNLVLSLEINDKVIFTGLISREQIPNYLCNATLLVLTRPNNYQASGGFPTKLGEYLSTGRPVLITRTGEIGDYLKDGIDCFFAEPGNLDSILSRLSFVFNNYVFAEQVGRNGQKKAYTVFNYKYQTQRVLEFFDSIFS